MKRGSTAPRILWKKKKIKIVCLSSPEKNNVVFSGIEGNSLSQTTCRTGKQENASKCRGIKNVTVRQKKDILKKPEAYGGGRGSEKWRNGNRPRVIDEWR